MSYRSKNRRNLKGWNFFSSMCCGGWKLGKKGDIKFVVVSRYQCMHDEGAKEAYEHTGSYRVREGDNRTRLILTIPDMQIDRALGRNGDLCKSDESQPMCISGCTYVPWNKPPGPPGDIYSVHIFSLTRIWKKKEKNWTRPVRKTGSTVRDRNPRLRCRSWRLPGTHNRDRFVVAFY